MTRGQICRIDGIGYPVADVSKARRFYEALFGMEPIVATSFNVVFQLPELRFSLGQDRRPAPPDREGVLITWTTDDLEATVALIEKHGGSVYRRWEEGEEGRPHASATVEDPFGNFLAIKQIAPA